MKTILCLLVRSSQVSQLTLGSQYGEEVRELYSRINTVEIEYATVAASTPGYNQRRRRVPSRSKATVEIEWSRKQTLDLKIDSEDLKAEVRRYWSCAETRILRLREKEIRGAENVVRRLSLNAKHFYFRDLRT